MPAEGDDNLEVKTKEDKEEDKAVKRRAAKSK
jgi:hypothetical protein